MIRTLYLIFYFFFFNDTATTEIYTLSLHDALPIYVVHQTAGQVHAAAVDRAGGEPEGVVAHVAQVVRREPADAVELDRKSTRLNSSHVRISYAVFCLKKKKRSHITYDNHTIL